MSVILDTQFACSVDDYWDRIFLTEDYQSRLHIEGLGFGSYRCLEHRKEGPVRVFRSIQVSGVPGLPRLVQKLVPGGGYVERGQLDRSGNHWSFVIEPVPQAVPIRITGEVHLSQVSGDRCRRIGEIKIAVKLPAIGQRLSRSLRGLVQESQKKSVVFTHSYIEELKS
jgi:hypothetical protein